MFAVACNSCRHDSPDSAAWDEFVARARGGHHVQSSAWAAVKADQGWESMRLTVSRGDVIVAGVQIAVKRVSLLGAIGYIDRGPLWDDAEPAAQAAIATALASESRRHGLAMVLVQPPDGVPATGDVLRSGGLVPSLIQVAMGATVLTDLRPEPNEILARMRSKTRYNIRKGLRSNLEVRVGGERDLPIFCDMLAATSKRQGFTADVGAVSSMFRRLAPRTELLIAEHAGEPISGILTVAFGDRVVYKRGAWSGKHGSLHPNERLHWEAMQRAKAKGFRYYDFEGIDRGLARQVLSGAPLPAEGTRSLTAYKLGFGGAVLLPDPMVLFNRALYRWGHDVVYSRLADTARARQIIDRLRRCVAAGLILPGCAEIVISELA